MVSKRLHFTFLLFFVVILLRFIFLTSHFFSNIAWLHLSRAKTSEPVKVTSIRSALDLFRSATRIDGTNQRAFLGMGIGYSTIGDEMAALASWQEAGPVSDVLIAMANSFLSHRLYDEALTYYKGAIYIDPMEEGEVTFLAVNVCQIKFEQLSMLSQTNQEFCREQFSQNGDNLIVNGQLASGTLIGWGKRYFSRATSVIYAIDETNGSPPPSVSVTGVTEAYHGGLFQTIALPADAEVRYSAWFKVQHEGEISVRLLYVSGQQDGQPFGNASHTVNDEMEWTYFERTVRLPQVDSSLYTFFPTLITGEGTVWVDDVKVEVLAGK